MDSFKHNVSTIDGGQATFQQCWYASYRTLLKFHNRNPNEVDDKLAPAINLDDAKTKGLLDTDFRKTGAALGLKMWAGTPFKDTSVFDFDVSSGAKAFLKELKISPLWVSRFVGPGSYHIIVATGYSDEGRGYIIYNNPFPGPNNAVEVTTLPATLFCRDITSAMGSVQAVR